MNYKPYKSPLGFRFTAQEERMYHKALVDAARFFLHYGKGRQPQTEFGVVRDVRKYKLAYYSQPVGSLEVIRQKEAEQEDPGGDWMTLAQLSEALGYSDKCLCSFLRRKKVEPHPERKRGRCNLYRYSEVRALIEEGRDEEGENAPILTGQDILSGRWLCKTDLSERLHIPYPILSANLANNKAPYKILRLSVAMQKKFYDIEALKRLPFMERLINKYNL